MSWYQLLLFLHVSMAVIWVGGGLMIQIVALRFASHGDPARTAAFGREIGWIGTRVFAPSSLLAFLTGILLVADSDFYEITFGWILLSLLLYAVTFLVGALVLGPESAKVGQLLAEGSAEAGPRRLRLTLITRLDTVLLFFVIFLMTVQPQLDSDELLTGIIGAVLAAGIVWWRYRTALTAMTVQLPPPDAVPPAA